MRPTRPYLPQQGVPGSMASTTKKKISYDEGSLDQYLRDISA
jgi:hypothetical protein